MEFYNPNKVLWDPNRWCPASEMRKKYENKTDLKNMRYMWMCTQNKWLNSNNLNYNNKQIVWEEISTLSQTVLRFVKRPKSVIRGQTCQYEHFSSDDLSCYWQSFYSSRLLLDYLFISPKEFKSVKILWVMKEQSLRNMHVSEKSRNKTLLRQVCLAILLLHVYS